MMRNDPNVAGPVAIVDYGLGNLYSVKHACAAVGLDAIITSVRAEILAAPAVILPGVGAFGDAMETLARLDLVSVIRDVAAASRPLLGVCLGMQLLMTESEEFGRHRGLGLIDGVVVRLPSAGTSVQESKVPQIGWNAIRRYPAGAAADPWAATVLDGVPDGEQMYFVHSYVVQPQDPALTLSTSSYGGREFCSSLKLGSVVACQFHPERSGPAGLRVYRNFAHWVAQAGDPQAVSAP